MDPPTHSGARRAFVFGSVRVSTEPPKAIQSPRCSVSVRVPFSSSQTNVSPPPPKMSPTGT
jgi:hypothetical protein